VLQGFGKRSDDEPGWQEKLADWRNNPPWVFERPGWLRENPTALLLFFGATVAVVLAVVYVAVPPKALPAEVPGKWSPPVTSSTTSSTTSTTTTVPAAVRAQQLAKLAALPADKKAKAWGYIRGVSDARRKEAEIEAIVNSPVQPPFRRWAFAFFAAVAAAGLLVGAWFASDLRGKRTFGE
jgi:hypothetical protein